MDASRWNRLIKFNKSWMPLGLILSLILTCGCALKTAAITETPQYLPGIEATHTSALPTPFSSSTVSSPELATSVPVTNTPTPVPETSICSPIADLDKTGLADHITNPYFLPPRGSDNPHQGIDISDFFPDTRVAAPGRGVQSVLAGVISGVMEDVFPYGNAIMIETPLDEFVGLDLAFPGPFTDLPFPTTLTCPSGYTVQIGEDRSLYLLYAHMLSEPVIQDGESVACGDPLGEIGDSGNALNPHLHLEARVGPAGINFSGMRHYDPSASANQMALYCLWRVSGYFQAIDPMSILDPTRDE